MENSGPPQLAEAMQQLWKRFLPLLVERVATLETVASAAAKRTLTAVQREEACSAAHKLAGVLGTFGLNDGTVLAREAEAICGRENNAELPDPARLTAIAAQLREMLSRVK
jgi:HPt (histidine-containing phosphotransfer) domain-containing protein